MMILQMLYVSKEGFFVKNLRGLNIGVVEHHHQRQSTPIGKIQANYPPEAPHIQIGLFVKPIQIVEQLRLLFVAEHRCVCFHISECAVSQIFF